MAAVAVLLVVTVAGLHLGAAATAAHRARAAADLSALAGATALQSGGDACTRSAAIATANQGRLVECVVGVGETVRVRVSVPVGTIPGVPRQALAAARAGPADVPSAN